MKTLAVQDGDLVLGASGYVTTRGLNKTVQDLGIALREHVGIDRFHPKWGSGLNSLIGRPIDVLSQMQLESEARRVINNYMAVQREQALHMTQRGAKVQQSEMVAQVVDVRVERWWTTWVKMVVVLRMMDGNSFTLDLSVEE